MICNNKLNALLQNTVLKQDVEMCCKRAEKADAALVTLKQVLSQQQKSCSMVSPVQQQDSHSQVRHTATYTQHLIALLACAGQNM